MAFEAFDEYGAYNEPLGIRSVSPPKMSRGMTKEGALKDISNKMINMPPKGRINNKIKPHEARKLSSLPDPSTKMSSPLVAAATTFAPHASSASPDPIAEVLKRNHELLARIMSPGEEEIAVVSPLLTSPPATTRMPSFDELDVNGDGVIDRFPFLTHVHYAVL